MKKLLLILLLTFYTLGFSQESNNWYFGNKAGISFNNGTVSALTNGQLNTIEGSSTISDNSGQILFYTNGQTIWNKNHVPMQNGTGLFGHLSSSQAAVIVPKPGSTTIFYVFTTNALPEDGGLRYSIVDLSTNSGNGAVTAKNILIYDGTCEKLSVVNHNNGQDVWVVSHKWNSNAFESHLITASGISPAVTMSNAGCVVEADSDYANAIGYMKLSPDGTKLAVCHTFMGLAELFDFDNSTGVVSNPKTILTDGMHPYGVEFSPSSNALYISTDFEKKLFRFDMTAFDVAASKVVVADLPQMPGALQLGPNGKIYVAMTEQENLSVISNPNAAADACMLQISATDLNGRMCLYGLPSFNQSVFDMKINIDNTCSGIATQFEFDIPQAVSAISWDFGDNSTTNEIAPSHIYAVGGTYTVSASAETTSGPVTLTKTITITNSGIAFPIPNQALCIEQNAVYNLSQNNVKILGNQSDTMFGVAYYFTLEDAQNHTNALTSNFVLTPGIVTIYAKIINILESSCGAIISFTVTSYQQPKANPVSVFTTCDEGTKDSFSSFDLTTKDAEVLGIQSASDFAVTYFTSELDAQSNVAPISGVFYNTSNPQTVYARIENIEGGCSDIIAFDLKVENCDTGIDQSFTYPKFITPNGDGYHDVWEFKSSQDMPNSIVSIFDRYGKLLKTITETDSWDATANGTLLPSSDYWFIAIATNGKEFRGHFSVKR